MGSSSRRLILCGAVALLGAAAGGCATEAQPVQRQLVIATGDETGVSYLLGSAFAESINARIPDVHLSVLQTTGSGFNIQAVEEGRADVAFSQSDMAYTAVREGSEDHPDVYRNVLALGLLYVKAVQIVAKKDSDIHTLSDIAGRRLGVGGAGSGTELATQIIFREYALKAPIVDEPLALEDRMSQLRSGALDAAFIVSSYPVPAVEKLNLAVGLRLIPVEADLGARIREKYPFYRPLVVPAGTYSGQDTDLITVGVDNLLVVRGDLPDELVYQMTRTLVESLPGLSEAHPAAAGIDPEQASATPIPLHPGAARFYRERSLFR